MRRPLSSLTGLAPYVLASFFLAGVQHFMFVDFVSTPCRRSTAPHFWTYFAGVALFAAGLGLRTCRSGFWWSAQRRHGLLLVISSFTSRSAR